MLLHMATQYDTLVQVAADNHGLVRAADAAELGIAPPALTRYRNAGRIEQLARGVYHVVALPTDRLTPYMEAVMWANGHGAISHASALEMMDLCEIVPRRIHLTVPARYNPRKAGGERYRVHRHTLPDADITAFEGVPVVTAYRAIRQAIASGEDREQLRTAVRTATRQGLLLRREAAKLWAMLR